MQALGGEDEPGDPDHGQRAPSAAQLRDGQGADQQQHRPERQQEGEDAQGGVRPAQVGRVQVVDQRRQERRVLPLERQQAAFVQGAVIVERARDDRPVVDHGHHRRLGDLDGH